MAKTPPPPTPSCCDFCLKPNLVMFRSPHGGMPSRVCGQCVMDYARVISDAANAFEDGQLPVAEAPAREPAGHGTWSRE